MLTAEQSKEQFDSLPLPQLQLQCGEIMLVEPTTTHVPTLISNNDEHELCDKFKNTEQQAGDSRKNELAAQNA
ncbi:unnamed protein product [Rotaria sp. Silwood2]|nr:unnamed protein product [Rotaria sp. Silwood2]CAF3067185.1 unnamed protein product [Rotaria sp. Silwood2]CAF3371391.1 unnamed protein product [Rotaria sp. Silwood2]CAF4305077.1 unnamed protein product [Rotaria sp. Silwood2]CAF4324485.1 unnamed protein product [Rotaria sp. Silwood2]